MPDKPTTVSSKKRKQQKKPTANAAAMETLTSSSVMDALLNIGKGNDDDQEDVDLEDGGLKKKQKTFKMDSSSVLDRVASFLPQLANANENLKRGLESGDIQPEDVDIEAVKDGSEYVEMKLGLGVFDIAEKGTEEAKRIQANNEIKFLPKRETLEDDDNEEDEEDSDNDDDGEEDDEGKGVTFSGFVRKEKPKHAHSVLDIDSVSGGVGASSILAKLNEGKSYMGVAGIWNVTRKRGPLIEEVKSGVSKKNSSVGATKVSGKKTEAKGKGK
ncbi:hypothetical protein HDU76_011257 [Blyttiomyces sp. JEL0837]|nr:hypothetical protein HDU76_011257 [Blyttiomyces sp. JEL0837]